MDPEDRKLMYRTLKLAEDNNEMLRKLYRAMRLSRAIKIGYWTVIIVLTVGAYYIVQPYITHLYSGLQGMVDNIHKLGDILKNTQ